MTFNESCFAIENYIGGVNENINNTLSNLYAIESQFNMGIAFEADDASETFGQKLKEKIKSIGEMIANAFKRIGKFFSDIFSSIKGDTIAYNKNLVKKQCGFIKNCTQSIIDETQSNIASESALFIVMEAKSDDEKLAEQMTKGREKAEKAREKSQVSLANRIEKSKQVAKTLGEKFNTNADNISISQDTRADISVKDASKLYNDTYKECKKQIINAFNDLRKTTSEKDKKATKKATSLIKRISKLMALNSAMMQLMRTSKIK